MSDKVCPVCGGKLHVFPRENSIVCVSCGFDGNLKLWQELITTRKALDVAVGFVEEMAAFYNSLNISTPDTTVNWDVVAKLWADKNYKALEQINEIIGANKIKPKPLDDIKI